MEFHFDFIPTPRKRLVIVHRLFAGNPHLSAPAVVSSSFLSVLTLKVTVGLQGFSEELSTPNVAGGNPFVIYTIKGTPHSLDVSCGQLETLCKRCGGELPSEPFAPGPARRPRRAARFL
jgi:hypothetical protein